MHAQEVLIDVTANNLANVNTAGFKRSRVDFADLLYSTLKPAGTEAASGVQTPTGLQVGSGVRPVSTTKIFSPGTFAQTGNPLDVAIEGDGFFRIELPTGDIRYTRSGTFKLDNTGKIVTADGYSLSGNLTVPQGVPLDRISIGADGTVSGIAANAPGAPITIGTIQIARFLNPAGLSSEGSNLYAESPASGTEQLNNPGTDGMGTLRQGFLEGANVEVVTELIGLISAQRAYEINSRAIRAGDEMLSVTSEIIR
jgi:flagellar basal-body rod protein FlgG